jgi:hypothetical protein
LLRHPCHAGAGETEVFVAVHQRVDGELVGERLQQRGLFIGQVLAGNGEGRFRR